MGTSAKVSVERQCNTKEFIHKTKHAEERQKKDIGNSEEICLHETFG